MKTFERPFWRVKFFRRTLAQKFSDVFFQWKDHPIVYPTAHCHAVLVYLYIYNILFTKHHEQDSVMGYHAISRDIMVNYQIYHTSSVCISGYYAIHFLLTLSMMGKSNFCVTLTLGIFKGTRIGVCLAICATLRILFP